MSRSGDQILVCGFADPGGAVAGACWRLGGIEGGALLAGDAVSPARVEFADADPRRLRLAADGASCEAVLNPRPALVDLPGPEGEPSGVSAAICAAEVEFEFDGRSRSLSCPGHLTTSRQQDLLDGAESARHLAIPLGDEGLVVVLARRPAGAEGHGDEEVTGWRLEPEGGAAPFAESLLSTQYDRDGRQTRAGLELWPATDEDAHPMRAAGTSIGVAEGDGVAAALLRTSSEGREGVGDYLIWRR